MKKIAVSANIYWEIEVPDRKDGETYFEWRTKIPQIFFEQLHAGKLKTGEVYECMVWDKNGHELGYEEEDEVNV